jgi:ubiquinone/menaquinone biosynthesis C-methylase UbiE
MLDLEKVKKFLYRVESIYNMAAAAWDVKTRDPVVGSFDQHNTHADYDKFLFKGIETDGRVALDFGCGPGRNIVRFVDKFQRIDGVDIAEINLNKAKVWCKYNFITEPILYKTNGYNLDAIPSEYYDIVMSTITMQHICLYDVRFNFLQEFFRVLKPGGWIAIQMGFGSKPGDDVEYYDNAYHKADPSNSMQCIDVQVRDPEQLNGDLDKIGFIDFSYDIADVGPGDNHDNWIFFRAHKPN